MINKDQLDKLITEHKNLGSRTEAAEAKVKELEAEKEKLVLASKAYSSGSSNVNSDEQRALRMFGKSHPRDLLDVNVGDPKFKGVPDEVKYTVINLKRAVDVARYTAQMFNHEAFDVIGKDEKGDRIPPVRSITETYYGKNVLVPTVKAFGSTVSGAGLEWVPTAISSTYLEEYELKRVLEGRFGQINMPTNPFVLPKLKGVTKARKATEGQTNFAASNFQTDKITFTATKLEEFYELPEELTEDSAPDFLSAGRDEVVKSQERAAESAIINGDSDGTHIDSDTQAGAAELAEKVWDGLRKLAIANSGNGATLDFTASAITESLLRQLRASMGKFGSSPEELLWIVGPSLYTQFLALPSVITIDKMGPMATILKGALAAYQGIPIVNSEHFREDLNASGVYDGVTTNLGGLLLCNTKRFYVGQRRPIKVKLMPDLPGSDRWLLASYRRVDFKGHAQGAVEKSVVYGYNIAK